jgi:dihydroxyacetone kinase-like protein
MTRPKKIINNPHNVVQELLEGLVEASNGRIKPLSRVQALVKSDIPKDKVGLLIGGGSGHEPVFHGFIGDRLADGAACGNIFAAPTPDIILETTKAVHRGRGVLYLYGNYAGDNLETPSRALARVCQRIGEMGKSELSLPEVREMIVAVSRGMIASTDRLTQADKAIGDGDHGVGMARGFAGVIEKVEGREFTSIGHLFKTVGTAILTTAGGAAGAVFGTLFRGAAENVGDRSVLTAALFSRMLFDGLRAVKARGQAKPGDKTMIDALEPAAVESERQSSAPFDEALTAIAKAARLGMEKTREMVATVGKAKTLGERSLGHPDPGALSMSLILEFMAEYATQKSDQNKP